MNNRPPWNRFHGSRPTMNNSQNPVWYQPSGVRGMNPGIRTFAAANFDQTNNNPMNFRPQMVYQQPVYSHYQTFQRPAVPPPIPPQASESPNPPLPGQPQPPLPPKEANKEVQPPPPPMPSNSPEKWWTKELSKLTLALRSQLENWTKQEWFLRLDTNQQIQHWQNQKSGLNAKVKEEGTDKKKYAGDQAQTHQQPPDKGAKEGSRPNVTSQSGGNSQTGFQKNQKRLSFLTGENFKLKEKMQKDEATFQEWSAKHVNHPNKTLYQQYNDKWKQLKNEMETKIAVNQTEIDNLSNSIKHSQQPQQSATTSNNPQHQGASASQPVLNIQQNNQYQQQQQQQQPASFPNNAGANMSHVSSNPAVSYQQNAPMRPVYPQQPQMGGNQMATNAPGVPALRGQAPNVQGTCAQAGPQAYQTRNLTPNSNYPPNQVKIKIEDENINQGSQMFGGQPQQQQGGFNAGTPTSNSYGQPRPQNFGPPGNNGMKQQPQGGGGTNPSQFDAPQRMQGGGFQGNNNRMPTHNNNFQRFPSSNVQHGNMNMYDNKNDSQFPRPNSNPAMGDNQQNLRSPMPRMPRQRMAGPTGGANEMSNDESMPMEQEQQQQQQQNQPHMQQRFPANSQFNQQRFGNQQQRPRGPPFQPGNMQRPRFPNNAGMNEGQQPRFPNNAGMNEGQRPRFPNNAGMNEGQRPRFPNNSGMNEGQRPRFPNNAGMNEGQRPRFPNNAGMNEGQRPRFPNNAGMNEGQRPRFPNNAGMNEGQRPRFPNNAGMNEGQRPRFPNNAGMNEGQRPRFPNNAGMNEGQRPRFPNNAGMNEGQRPRFPNNAGMNEGQRPRFPNNAGMNEGQRPRFPNNAGMNEGQRPRFNGPQQFNNNFPQNQGRGMRPRMPMRSPGPRTAFPNQPMRPRMPTMMGNNLRFNPAMHRPRFPVEGNDNQAFYENDEGDRMNTGNAAGDPYYGAGDGADHFSDNQNYDDAQMDDSCQENSGAPFNQRKFAGGAGEGGDPKPLMSLATKPPKSLDEKAKVTEQGQGDEDEVYVLDNDSNELANVRDIPPMKEPPRHRGTPVMPGGDERMAPGRRGPFNREADRDYGNRFYGDRPVGNVPRDGRYDDRWQGYENEPSDGRFAGQRAGRYDDPQMDEGRAGRFDDQNLPHAGEHRYREDSMIQLSEQIKHIKKLKQPPNAMDDGNRGRGGIASDLLEKTKGVSTMALKSLLSAVSTAMIHKKSGERAGPSSYDDRMGEGMMDYRNRNDGRFRESGRMDGMAEARRQGPWEGRDRYSPMRRPPNDDHPRSWRDSRMREEFTDPVIELRDERVALEKKREEFLDELGEIRNRRNELQNMNPEEAFARFGGDHMARQKRIEVLREKETLLEERILLVRNHGIAIENKLDTIQPPLSHEREGDRYPRRNMPSGSVSRPRRSRSSERRMGRGNSSIRSSSQTSDRLVRDSSRNYPRHSSPSRSTLHGDRERETSLTRSRPIGSRARSPSPLRRRRSPQGSYRDRSRSPLRRRRSRSPRRSSPSGLDRRRSPGRRRSPARRGESPRRSPRSSARRSPAGGRSRRRSRSPRSRNLRDDATDSSRLERGDRGSRSERSKITIKDESDPDIVIIEDSESSSNKASSDANRSSANPPAPRGSVIDLTKGKVKQNKIDLTKSNAPIFGEVRVRPIFQSANYSEPVILDINDLLDTPGRLKRPPRIALFLRGLPGSGKTYTAKLIRERENNHKVSPRVLCLDDYFMAEVEKTVKDAKTGRSVKKKSMEYEYEESMEDAYRGNMMRVFNKTLEDGYFTFVIIDAINDKVSHFRDAYLQARDRGFVPFVAEITADATFCAKRNVHDWTLKRVQKLANGWEKTPSDMNKVDLRQLIQASEITEVEMVDISDEDVKPEIKKEGKAKPAGGSKRSIQEIEAMKSKWDTDSTSKLDKLDGIKKKVVQKTSMEEFISVTDDYTTRTSAPGKKRVRWADIEERETQKRMRDVGFVVGGTDWSRMMDDSHASRALNRTKFI